MTAYNHTQPPALPPHDHPLSPRGRFARLAYMAWYLIISVVIFTVAVLAMALFGSLTTGDSADPTPKTGQLIVLGIAYLVFFYYAVVLGVRRLHDLNKTGWLTLLWLVPLINIIFLLYLMAAKGSVGANDYGLPRANKGWEKVAGIVYIILTVASIVVLGWVSVNSYQTYTERAGYAQTQSD
ncbi:MAG: DUF805 domain-containing protein [Moraxellaceae bacterium]|nr:MAG: DUF805 domain-containing protein [Moraxellaceae bacterium]